MRISLKFCVCAKLLLEQIAHSFFNNLNSSEQDSIHGLKRQTCGLYTARRDILPVYLSCKLYYMEVSWNRGTPSHHPFLDGIFPIKNHPAIGGTSNSMETPISSWFFECLTGWQFGTFFIFPYIGNFIIPIDELIFFRGVALAHQPVDVQP